MPLGSYAISRWECRASSADHKKVNGCEVVHVGVWPRRDIERPSWSAPAHRWLMEGAMPWSNVRAKSVPRVEYDHRARQSRLALERLERALVAPVSAGPLRLALRGLAHALRGKAGTGDRPCRGDDYMASEDSSSRTAPRRRRAEIAKPHARRSGVAAQDDEAIGSGFGRVGWPTHGVRCGLAVTPGIGASSRTRKLPSIVSAR
jgi:hypothetical protein